MPQKSDAVREKEAKAFKRELCDSFASEDTELTTSQLRFLLELFGGTTEQLQSLGASLEMLEDNQHLIPADLKRRVLATQKSRIFCIKRSSTML